MRATTLALLLSLSVGTAVAGPIAFDSVAYTTFAFADADGTPDGPDFDDSPPTPLPLHSEASALVLDIAGAAATADAAAFVIAATSEVSAASGAASGVGVATFTGHFTAPGGPVSFSVDFATLSDAFALGTVSLFVFLEADGFTLVDEELTTPTPLTGGFDLAAGAAGVFDLTLISTSAVEGAGEGFNEASASFALRSAIPEPGSLALLLAGLLPLARIRSGKPRG